MDTTYSTTVSVTRVVYTAAVEDQVTTDHESVESTWWSDNKTDVVVWATVFALLAGLAVFVTAAAAAVIAFAPTFHDSMRNLFSR